jgi:hypothetical protein
MAVIPHSAFFFLLCLRKRVAAYGDLQMRVRCGAICLIALFVALFDWKSNQERGASKQLAPLLPYTHLQTDLLWDAPSGGVRDHKESCCSSASQLVRPAIPLYFTNVRVEKSVLGRIVSARRSFFRRPQQFAEAIGVHFPGDI